MPDGVDIGPTHGGVAVDDEGKIYVSTEAEHGVVRFSKDGDFEKKFGPETSSLHSLTIVKEGEEEVLLGAAVADQKVLKMGLDGDILMTIPNETTGEIPKGFKGVTGAAMGPEGEIYVVCGYGSNLLHKFDRDGKLLKSAGSLGESEGQFRTCHGITIDDRGKGEPKLLICDRENRRLVHFDLDLNYFGVHATDLRRPCAVSLRNGFAAVAELEGRVTILDSQGVPVAFLGDQPNEELWAKKPVPAEKLYDGLFTSPHGVSWDAEGNLIVQDWNETGRVTKLARVERP
jgi:DNA-binding beta-propeller fold protein YncE